MKRIVVAGIAVVAFWCPAAFAADIPAKAPYYKVPAAAIATNWAGLYTGFNAGGAWGNSDPRTIVGGPANPPGYFGAASISAIAAVGRQSLNPKGFTGGIQAGYNWQSGNWVAGIESDFNYFGLNESTSSTAPYPPAIGGSFTITSHLRTDWLATARPRLGWAVDNWLVYVTGGVAVTRLKTDYTFSDTLNGRFLADGASKIKAGWTVGGGLEWMFPSWSRWTAKVEYLYTDLGNVSSTGVLPPIGFGNTAPNTLLHNAGLTSHIVRFGLNYKFI
jgi:outer membrane immunogenic protein